MSGRLENVFEGLIMALVMCGIFFVIALIAKLVFKKFIGTGKYYSVAVVLGFIISGVLVPAILKSEKADSAAATQPAAGLDASFIAPPPDKMESFIQQLKTATDKLSPADQMTLNDALAFLTFAAGDDVRQHDPAKFAKWGDTDVLAHSMVKLYNYARDQGDQMTLRKYVVLADEFKKQQPDVLQRYTAAMIAK
jgi:hypothetical protein